MPKSKVDPFLLAQKYLISIGVSKTTVAITLLPSKFESTIYCVSQKKSNVIAQNKKALAGNETHIAISNSCHELFFSTPNISAFKTTGARHEQDQSFNFFEANISAMIDRRSKSKSPLVIPKTATRVYLRNDDIISGTGCKWINSHSGSVQVHLGKNQQDSNEFTDFRLGILIDDYLLMFKSKFSDEILAISIPREFASRYLITKASPKITKKQQQQNDEYENADAIYAKTASSNVTPITTAAAPTPAPPPKRTSSGKPRYSGNPAIGKGAIQKALYQCEYDKTHSTFTARSTGQQFMEPHHLIPISSQGLFSSSIDITSNIICLCPNCHSEIHYGEKAAIKRMLKYFLALRAADLKTCGIDIDEDTLFALYK